MFHTNSDTVHPFIQRRKPSMSNGVVFYRSVTVTSTESCRPRIPSLKELEIRELDDWIFHQFRKILDDKGERDDKHRNEPDPVLAIWT